MQLPNTMYKFSICLKRSAFFVLISFIFLPVTGQTIENKAAKEFAEAFFSSRNRNTLRTKSNTTSNPIVQLYQSTSNVKTPLHVFRQGDEGFVILAQGLRNFVVVGYSDKNVFDPDAIPPQLTSLLNFYEESNNISRLVLEPKLAVEPVVSPLLDLYGVKLNQYGHAEVDGCPTGCAATAVTQVMLYHAARLGKLIQGYGSYCYTDDAKGEICADFSGITYDNNELLSFHVGNSMEMQYCGSPFGSIPNKDFAEGLENHFQYFTGPADTEDYFIKNELEHGRPVYINLSGEPVGHAFVIDGYDSQGFYHLNLGWGGSYNGYYALNTNDKFSPEGYYIFNNKIESPRIISPVPIPVTEEDSLALIAIHNALGGSAVTGWDLTKPVFTWPGVLLMNERVIKLALGANVPPATSQSIAPEIGNLTGLRELNISGCLNGNIPSSISNLTELRKLSIVNNAVYIEPVLHKGNLSGEIPPDIGNLTKLEWLTVSNALRGTIPSSFVKLKNLTLLRIYQDTVTFGQGKLSGVMPPEIGNLGKLRNLVIQNQQLSGNIPSSIKNLTGLWELVLSGNQLTGNVPALNLPTLEYLVLNDNLFTSFAEGDANCPELKEIQLQNNQLSGIVPSWIGNFTSLKSLNLSDNQLESLPSEIGNCIHLQNIHLDNNYVSALPDGLAVLAGLKHLHAKNNRIGYIPSNLGQSKSFETLDLSYNQIAYLPEELGNSDKLYELYFNNNKITRVPESFSGVSLNSTIWLHDNEIQGKIPEALMISDSRYLRAVRLDGNRFVFNDIPESDSLRTNIHNQKNIPVTKQVYKVRLGGKVSIDIRSITNLAHPGNQYYWITYPEHASTTVYDERFDGIENNPILDITINENNINNKYYCKVFNPGVPSYSYDYNGSMISGTCLDYLNTDTIVFRLASEEEIIAESFPDAWVTSLESVHDKTVADRTITLVPPLKIKRGEIYWEASSDNITWEKISETMQRIDLKSNVQLFSSEKLVIEPENTAYYRCVLHETNCDPFYSDPLKIKPLGNVLFDETINVTEESRTVSIDSIEVVVPLNFHDKDFRLTITKIDNPPATPGNTIAGTAYDVSVSFGEVFESPLLIKLKNIDKSKISEKNIDSYKAAYFDDKNRKWKEFDHGHVSLKDSSIVFTTTHLTKLSWWQYESSALGYTDVYERNNIKVFYKDGDTDFMKFGYGKKLASQPWHVAGIPLLVQDITEYLPNVMAKYKSLGLEVPDGKFSVYVKEMDDAGCVGILGMINGYMLISRDILTPVELRQVLAHEYMHYTQDYYISANPGNSFWMEAHATLADRLAWNNEDVPVCEAEQLMCDSRASANSIFNFLSNSWDFWDKSTVTNNMLGNIHYNYLAGTFLHYMRSEREASEKLEPATLLKETSWFGSWRKYLGSYTSNHLSAILGDEYEEYILHILSGKNEDFTVLNTKGNPFSYIQDPRNKSKFTHPVAYRFGRNDAMVKKDEMNITVPYMAAKVVLLENLNPDTMVLVNYKRNHEFSHKHLVYYGTYNVKTKQMDFVDISDSTEFNFLLDARNEENALTKFGNYSFLLLINKEYIGASALIKDFDASFELTAMPVMNIERIGMLNIYNGSYPITHNFDNGTKNNLSIGVPKPSFLQNATGFKVDFYKNSITKSILDDHTYQIETRFTLVIDQGFIKGAPTMKDSTTYTQTIDHDIFSGTLKVTEKEEKTHKLHTYIIFETSESEGTVEKLIHKGYTDKKENTTKIYWLKNFTDAMQPEKATQTWEESDGKGILLFETFGTSETQSMVTKIDGSKQILKYNQSGELTSEENMVYTGTDYTGTNNKLYLIIHPSDE